VKKVVATPSLATLPARGHEASPTTIGFARTTESLAKPSFLGATSSGKTEAVSVSPAKRSENPISALPDKPPLRDGSEMSTKPSPALLESRKPNAPLKAPVLQKNVPPAQSQTQTPIVQPQIQSQPRIIQQPIKSFSLSSLAPKLVAQKQDPKVPSAKNFGDLKSALAAALSKSKSENVSPAANPTVKTVPKIESVKNPQTEMSADDDFQPLTSLKNLKPIQKIEPTPTPLATQAASPAEVPEDVLKKVLKVD
jgi:hypothetical protein